MVRNKTEKIIKTALIAAAIIAGILALGAGIFFYMIRTNILIFEPSMSVIPKDILDERLEQAEEESEELLEYYREIGEYCCENIQVKLYYESKSDIFDSEILSNDLKEAVERTDLFKVYGGCETIAAKDDPCCEDPLGVLFIKNILMSDTSRTDMGQNAVYGICYLYDESYAAEIEKWEQTYALKKLDGNLYLFCKLYNSRSGYMPYEMLTER